MSFLLGSPTPNSPVSVTPQRGLGEGFNFGRVAKTKLLDFLNQEFGYASTFSFLVSNIQTLTQFDWNATDEEIKQEYETIKSGLAAAGGDLFGQGIGAMVAIPLGGFAGLTVPKISGAGLARELMKASSEEAKEEIIGNALSVVQYMKNSATKVLVLEGYMRFRTFLKGVDEPILAAMFGAETAKYIKRVWGTKTAPEFRIAEKFEEKIESIKNPLIRTFVEEAVESGFDTFIDLGMIIGIQLDEALQQYLLGTGAGSERTIELIPNSANPNESYIFENQTNEEIEINVNNFLNNWRMARQNEIRQFIAKEHESFRSSPLLRRLVLVFSSTPTGEHHEDGSSPKLLRVSIPNVKKPIKWSEIKRTVKVYSDYAWTDGNFTGKGRLQGGNRRIEVKAKDANEAVKVIKELVKLSDDELLDEPNVIDSSRSRRDNRKVQKLYPLHGILQTKTVAASQRREFELNANSVGFEEDYFVLYTDDEPLDLPASLR
jgi:hypothetical protein